MEQLITLFQDILTEKFYKDLNRGKVEIGDILIVKDGATTGKSAFVIKLPEDGKASINEHVVLVRGLSNIDKNFLFRFIQILSQDFARKHSKGVIGGVKMSQLRSFPVPLPPLEEQHRIVKKIETLFGQVDKLEQKVEQDRTVDERLQVAVLDDLQQAETPEASQKSWQRITDHFEQIYCKPEHIDQLKQAILNEAVRGRLVPQDSDKESAEELLAKICKAKTALIETNKLKKQRVTKDSKKVNHFHLPNNWRWAKSYEILFTTKLAGFEYTKYIELKESGEVPVIRAQNVRPYKIDTASLKYINLKTSNSLERSALIKPCLLVTFIGAGIGDVAYFNEKRRWHLAPNVAKMEPFLNCDQYLNLRYLNYFLLSPVGKKELFKHLKATAQPSLSMSTIRDVNFAIPPIREQKRIVQKIEELFTWCDNLKKQLNSARQTDELLLETLVSGDKA